MFYQKGFRTERQGCLQVTGSNCNRGVSSFSLSGVYRAPMGTTSLDASYAGISHEAAEAPYNWGKADHAGAGEDVPAQTDAIAVLDLTPLLFQRLVIHDDADGWSA